MIDDTAIHEIVKRLGRPHRSGGTVIERAAIVASGADSAAILEWIVTHDGEPEAIAPTTRGGGLHGARVSDGVGTTPATPRRYVLPAAALA